MTASSRSIAAPGSRRSRADADLADLSPACFGMVMATGIVSITCAMLGLPRVAQVLFHLNVLVYLILWLLTVARIGRHRERVLADLADHGRGPGFFTAVAGTGVLASQFLLLAGNPTVASGLWLLAIVLWLILTYGIFAALTVKDDKPTLDRGINGGWLLAVVATQATAMPGVLLVAHLPVAWHQGIGFFALAMWLWGGMLYIWLMALIFFRYTFYRLSPADLAPPYWINMGAMAISTLVGSLLVVNAPRVPLLATMLPFVKGFTLFYWASGTWWIPMLLVLGVWRHLLRRFPLRYDPLYWGAVFPLGMYAAATREMMLALAIDLPAVAALPGVFLTAALLAWTLTLVGLGVDRWRRWRPGSVPLR